MVPEAAIGHPWAGSKSWTLGITCTRFILAGPFCTQTLDSALLYLVLLRLLNRDYESVFRQINTCAVDVPFTQQEAWIFSQFSRTLDDKHPDAHSCRTKLALAVVYSDNKCKWEMHEELSRERGGTRRRVQGVPQCAQCQSLPDELCMRYM